MISNETYNLILENTSFLNGDTIHGALIMLDNKIWVDSLNRFVFPNKAYANKAFYNYMKWHAKYIAFLHSSCNSHRNIDLTYNRIRSNHIVSEEEYNECKDWKTFKKFLIEHHNFKIIEI